MGTISLLGFTLICVRTAFHITNLDVSSSYIDNVWNFYSYFFMLTDQNNALSSQRSMHTNSLKFNVICHYRKIH
jgi:hypothetical protein